MTAEGRPRLVWALTGGRTGDDAQTRLVAGALGGEVREIVLSYNALREAPNLRPGGSVMSVRKGREALRAPWPDVVVGTGRRSAPVALWIRRQSGGRTRLIHIGRPRAPARWFDLVLTTPQYGLRGRENVILSTLPCSPLPPVSQHSGHVLLVVGGDSWSVRVSRQVIERACAETVRIARDRGLRIRAVTAPRTSAAQVGWLRAALPEDAEIHCWTAGAAHNPYRDWLSGADEIVVIGDSASALSDALSTGAPTAIMPVDHAPWVRALLRIGAEPWLRGCGNLRLMAPPPFMPAILERLKRLGWGEDRGDGVIRVPNAREFVAREHEAALDRARAL